MNYIDAMRQALEALENIDRWLPTIGQRGLRDYEADAVRALRLAIAEAEGRATEQAEKQEPVGWRWNERGHWFDWTTDWTHYERAKSMGFSIEYAYAAPPRRQPLTQQQIDKIIMQHTGGFIGGMHFVHLARAIERAHGIGGET